MSRRRSLSLRRLLPLVFAVIFLIAILLYRNEESSWLLPYDEVALVPASRHGVGLVIVVGHFPTDRLLAQKAFRVLQRYNRTRVKSKHVRRNIPKGALVDLQRAFKKGSLGDEEQKAWLGSVVPNEEHAWKYVYFTEDDQILNARDLTHSHTLLNDGGIMIPHRLQPIPHPLDLMDIVDNPEESMLPESFVDRCVVEDVYADTDSCCDLTENPGKQMGPCDNIFWWMCGFDSKEQNHSRLESYEFFRLIEGTGIVSLAATEHARKCVPLKDERGCQKS